MTSTQTADTVLALTSDLTSTELEQGHLYLHQTSDLVRGATKGLSAAQWSFKPAPDQWSIAELVEHMVLTQDVILGPIRDQLKTAPAGASDRDYRQIDAILVNQFPDRRSKFPSPEIMRPTGRWAPDTAMIRLFENCERLHESLDTTPDLRQHVIPSPPIKAISKGAFEVMDGYEWILAAAAHTERHTKQILEVKAHSNFPSR